MTEQLALTPDELLTTTRAVRNRLDLDRPVTLEVIRDALTVALQAPSPGNTQRWHWIILTDPSVKARVAEYYKRAFLEYRATRPAGVVRTPAQQRMSDASVYLSEILPQVPVLAIGAISVGDGGLPEGSQANLWGAVLPAAWSFALALRARGLGTTWTTVHLDYESEVAEILGMPSDVRQGVMFPVAYTKGTDFKPGPRADLEAVLHVNGW